MTILLLALAFCTTAAIFDVGQGTIPNPLTYSLLLIGPFLHIGLALARGASTGAAMVQGGWSLVGILCCAAVPLFMWWCNAIGGGDVKLFAGLGGLLLPRFGFEAQMYALVVASLVAPMQMAYRGTLLRVIANVGSQVLNGFRPKARRRALDPDLTHWFRLGPCIALGVGVEMLLHWRSP
jgi:Flp pilus assembly protein protease CpaA